MAVMPKFVVDTLLRVRHTALLSPMLFDRVRTDVQDRYLDHIRKRWAESAKFLGMQVDHQDIRVEYPDFEDGYLPHDVSWSIRDIRAEFFWLPQVNDVVCLTKKDELVREIEGVFVQRVFQVPVFGEATASPFEKPVSIAPLEHTYTTFETTGEWDPDRRLWVARPRASAH